MTFDDVSSRLLCQLALRAEKIGVAETPTFSKEDAASGAFARDG